jgi:hypothetical protein
MADILDKHAHGHGAPASDTDNFDQYGDSHNNQPSDAVRPVNESFGGARDRGLERSGFRADDAQVDWRVELQHAVMNIRLLQQLDHVEGPVNIGNQTVDAALLRQKIEADTDRRFQLALDSAEQDSKLARAEVIRTILQLEQLDGRIDSTGAALGIQRGQLSRDDLQNEILNATTDTRRTQFTDYNNMTDAYEANRNRLGEAYVNQRGPMYMSLGYADYLMDRQNGVGGIDPQTGEYITAPQVILRGMRNNPEMAAHPEAQQMLRSAYDQQVQNQAQVLAGDHNPIAMLQYGLQSGDPRAFQAAFDLAHDKNFDDQVQKAIKDLEGKPDSPDKKQQMAALQDLAHAKALTEGYMGIQMLSQPGADMKQAQQYIMNAMEDPKVLHGIQDGRGNLLLPLALQQTVFKQNADFPNWAQAFNNDMQQVIQLGQAIKPDKDGKPVTGPEIDKAIAAANDAYQKADMMVKALGPNGEKLDKEYMDLKNKKDRTPEEEERMKALQPFHDVMHYKTRAGAMLATFDSAHGDFHAVAQLTDELKKDKAFLDDKENEQLKQQIDALSADAANKIHDEEESKKPWYERAFDTVVSLPGKVWDFMKDHWKLVALGVGLAVGIAATIATGGLAAPVVVGALGLTGTAATVAGGAVAIGGGILAGGLAGSLAGGELAREKGDANSLWDGMKMAAPSAFQGSAIGATLVGFAPVGAAAGAGEAGAAGAAGAETLAAAGTTAEGLSTAATVAEGTNTAVNAGRFAQLASKIPGVSRVMEGYGAAQEAVTSTNMYQTFANSGRIMTFANMGTEHAMLANMARMGSIAAISGVPANWNSDNFLRDYSNYVATGTLFGGLGKGGMTMRQFLMADAAKNIAFEATNPHSDNFGAGAYLRNVLLDTAGDASATIGFRRVPAYGAFYPIFANDAEKGFNSIYHLGEGLYSNRVNHQLSEYQIRMMNLTPDEVKAANDYLQHGDQPQQVQPAAQVTTGDGTYQQVPGDGTGVPVQRPDVMQSGTTGDVTSPEYYNQYIVRDPNQQ